MANAPTEAGLMRTRHAFELAAVLLFLAWMAGPRRPAEAAGAEARSQDALARVFLVDPTSLAETKRRVGAGDERLAPAVGKLRAEADEALTRGPFSVMDKKAVPPSGDKHDYMSVGPYWWPDPKTPDGKPYIRRDGEVNPERYDYDSAPLARMCEAVDTLALAYYLTGHEPYADHAATLLRTWFLDESTRMNPHLQFGQAIPGRCDGRGIGMIDTARLARLVDSIGILAGSPSWSEADQEGMVGWFAAYLRWSLESRYGQDESRARNNHGTWYDVQVAAYALFVGQENTAREVLSQVPTRRIATQIEPDGSQPLELARTKSFSYSLMNLRGMFDLATLGQHVGVDLWDYQTKDGRGICKALDWLIPYGLGKKKWQHKQITGLRPAGLFPLLRRAAVAYQEPHYEALIAELPADDLAADRTSLLYPRPGS